MTESCHVVDVDGEPVVVRGAGAFDEAEREAFAVIVRAARARLAEMCCGHGPQHHYADGCHGRVLRADETGAKICPCSQPRGRP